MYGHDGLSGNIALPKSYFGTFRTTLATTRTPITTTRSPLQQIFGAGAPRTLTPTVTVARVAPKLPVLLPKTTTLVKTATPTPVLKTATPTVPSFAMQASGGGSGTPLTDGGAPVAQESSTMSSAFDFKKSPLPLVLAGVAALYFVSKKKR